MYNKRTNVEEEEKHQMNSMSKRTNVEEKEKHHSVKKCWGESTAASSIKNLPSFNGHFLSKPHRGFSQEKN
jgi:hypothetical protein